MSKTDMILIYDSCYSGLATRGSEVIGLGVELISAVGSAQKAHGGFVDLARTQNITFTSRLATAVAQRVGQGISAISFAEIIGDIRGSSQPQRLPQYVLHHGEFGIRIPISVAKETAQKQKGSSSSDRLPTIIRFVGEFFYSLRLSGIANHSGFQGAFEGESP